MSAGTTNDSGDPSPLRGADRPVGTASDSAAGGKAQPKARTKRPRPTFDDGSVTRVFKFPSKSYPRSSYYVTSTEIIIRIKKARKKWKLIVPKKRVAAYRTNRWFAKPRWVEIELTYTQASKLGLVEPRTPSTEVTSGISVEQQVVRHPIADSDHTLPAGSASEPEPDSTSTSQRPFELDSSEEQPGRPLNTDDFVFVSDDYDPEDNTVLRTPLSSDGSQVRSLQTSLITDADVCSRSKSAVGAARSRSDRAAPRTGAFLQVASLGILFFSVAAAWITLSGPSTTPMKVDLACTPNDESSSCPQAIVTGSLGKVDQVQPPELKPYVASPTHASPELIAPTEQLEDGAPPIAKAATIPAEREDDSAKVGIRTDNRNEGIGTADAAVKSDPLPAGTTAKSSLLLPQNVPDDRHDCRELRAASQSMNIRFDYASSSLNQVILPALESFAVRLRSCPSTKVVIEGHTDSDGRAAWNQSLSVRRAKAVFEHLVHAGVQPSQLSAIGFGQSRPYAPNVSTKNKRSNRRVTLVVDVRR
jgi:outer membrane protein OmpA-like peptidoglycan-associated protein